MAAVERIRAAGEDENNQDKKDDKLPFASAVHTSTLFELELRSHVQMLKRMRLNTPFDELIPNIAAFESPHHLRERRTTPLARNAHVSAVHHVPCPCFP
jgi:hypothetical protein